MDLKQAYQMVFNDLRECRMFQGHYDAANSDAQYMWGIETVMEAESKKVKDIVAQYGAKYFVAESKNL